jgi:hypothetical protein
MVAGRCGDYPWGCISCCGFYLPHYLAHFLLSKALQTGLLRTICRLSAGV